jgi:hypothetical protein
LEFCDVSALQAQNKITGQSRQILFEGLPPQTQDLHGFFRLEVCYSTQETHMFIKRKLLFPLQAVLWTGLVLPMSFPILGLLAPQPGAPLGGRSLGIGDYWLLRIVETPTPTGSSWVMETNWLNLVLCAIIGGVAIAWIRSRHSDHAEQSGEREPPMTRVLKS